MQVRHPGRRGRRGRSARRDITRSPPARACRATDRGPRVLRFRPSLHLDGHDLRAVRLLDRKAALENLVARPVDARRPLQFSEHFEAGGAQLFADACRLGMEGIVSKNADSPYLNARSANWVKIKRIESGRFIIIGFLSNAPGRASSLILAEERNGLLVYSCRAGAGLDERTSREVYARLSVRERANSAVAAPRTPGARWVEPRSRVELRFHGRTGQDKPRAPVLTSFPEAGSW